MTNREYMESLDNLELVTWYDDIWEYCGQDVQTMAEYLCEEYKTTADEDLKNMNFTKIDEVYGRVKYHHKNCGFNLYIGKDGFNIEPLHKQSYSECYLDLLRKVSDKKRKEKGWFK